jgi:hypothetical protein
VADASKADAARVASTFVALGWSIEATEGTWAYLERLGMTAASAPKGKELMEAIRTKRWDLVVNVPGTSPAAAGDGARLRRTAAEEGVPILHTLEAAEAIALGLTTNR